MRFYWMNFYKTGRSINQQNNEGSSETYGVEENEALVEDLKRRGELLVVLLELANYFIGLLLWQFDEQTLICFNVKRSDVQMRLVC